MAGSGGGRGGFGGVAGSAGSAGSGGASGGSGGSSGCRPTGAERCDGVDNDCNGLIDEGGVCPCPVQNFGGRSYLFCDFVRSYRDADTFCLANGYRLTSIHDPVQNAWLESTVASYANTRWWIGLDDLRIKLVFQWIDDTPVDYLHWAVGEPNDSGGVEDCGQLNRFGPGNGWNDEPCDQALPFVCQSIP